MPDPADTIRRAGWQVKMASSLAQAQLLASQGNYLVGILALDPATSSPADFERLTSSGATEWIALLPPALLQDPVWVRLALESFYDHHTLPLDADRLMVILGHAFGRAALKHNLNRRREWAGRYQMIGRSAPMLELYGKIDRVTKVDAPVLIVGESGTGKELIARAVYQHSWRAKGPFVPVNCGGLAENLVQSELFGHEKGAFTGAHQRKIGSLESAAGGVVFLDEIGDLPLDLQANLLRFLQEKTIVRLGSTQRIPVDVRVIAATHVDLEKAVEAGRFREDLYYRLNVLHLKAPPLRVREGDVDLFVDALFREFAHQKNAAVQGFSQAAMRALREHPWPGNVRELVNRVQRALIMSDRRLLTPIDLGLGEPVDEENNAITLSRARKAVEKGVIQNALRANSNNVSKSARELGVSRVTLYRLMDKLNITPSARPSHCTEE
jgi:DNA-binding NtrC family response regulator